MPKGLKSTSAQIIVSGSVSESAINTFTEAKIDLQLNVLDREVFIVTGTNIDVLPPDCVAAVDTRTRASLTSTSRTSVGSLSSSNVIATARDDIRASTVVGAPSHVAFSTAFGETPAVGMDYLAIIATNDFFVQVEGSNNIVTKNMKFKLYGFRAVADAAVFAALTQSELLSA